MERYQLTPPEGKWKKTRGDFGTEFVMPGGVDEPTGITTEWRKALMLGGRGAVLRRIDAYPSKQKVRTVFARQADEPDQPMTYLIEDKDSRQSLDLLVHPRGYHRIVASMSIDHINDKPDFLGLSEFISVYDYNGSLMLLDIPFTSKPTMNFEELQSRSVEDNLRDLISIFQASGENGIFPAAARVTAKDNTEVSALSDTYMKVSRLQMQNKNVLWTDAEKDRIAQDIDFVYSVIEDLGKGSIGEKQKQNMYTFLTMEMHKALPENYPTLDSEEKDSELGVALQEAMVAAFRIYDESVRSSGEYNIRVLGDPQPLPTQYLLTTAERPYNHYLPNEREGNDFKPLRKGASHRLEKLIFTMRHRSKKHINIGVESIFSGRQQIALQVPRIIDFTEALSRITTTDQTGWEKALELFKIDITEL